MLEDDENFGEIEQQQQQEYYQEEEEEEEEKEEEEAEYFDGEDIYENNIVVVDEEIRKKWILTMRRVLIHVRYIHIQLKEKMKHSVATAKIDASFMQLDIVHDVLFSVPNLEFLHLQGNRLFKVPEKIATLSALRQLRLEDNQLLELPETLGQLTALQYLWLLNNRLSTLPDSIARCKNLVTLGLSGNPLRILPIGLGRCVKIKELLLNSEGISFPAQDVCLRGPEFTLKFLHRCDAARSTASLDISNLSLHMLSPEIAQLTNLTFLSFAKNSISFIPSPFGFLTRLTTLRFDIEKIQSPPEAVSMQGVDVVLSFLRCLHIGTETRNMCLDGFQLQSVPTNLLDLINLRFLNFNRNCISVIPPGINAERFPRIVKLEMDDNVISQIPPPLFRMTFSTLSLEGNKIERIPTTLGMCVSLTELRLGRNLITAVPASISQLTNLRTCLLSNNLIDVLTPTIAGASNLCHLTLEANRFIELPVHIGSMQNLNEDTLLVEQNDALELPPIEIRSANRKLEFLNAIFKSDGFTLDLSNFDILAVPRISLRMHSLRTLILSHNQLTVLPADPDSLSLLARLDLSYNKFTVFPSCVLRLQTLTEINLDFNSELDVLPLALGTMPKLQRLTLEGNVLKQPPMEVVKRGIGAIKTFLSNVHGAQWSGAVILSGQHLRFFPGVCLDLALVREMDLSNNHISFIPESIASIVGIASLNVSYNQLDILPATIGKMRDLKFLAVNSNKLTELPDGIGGARKLRRLLLHNNQLTQLPDTIRGLTKLLELCCTNNKLRSIPQEIGSLRQLQQLQLSHNQLTEIPKVVGSLSALTELAVMNNNLSSLPPALGNLPLLERLAYKGNPFEQPPREILDAGVSIVMQYFRRLSSSRISKNLNMQGFGLTCFPPEIKLLNRAGITQLILDDNHITVAPPELTALESLTLLSACRNMIKAIPKEWYRLSALTVLQLEENRLRRVPLELGLLTGLVRLDLFGNLKLRTPPRELLVQPTKSVIHYLRNALEATRGQKVLDWRGMQLQGMISVSWDIEEFHGLETLLLDRNSLTKFEATMCAEMTALRVLHLTRNSIREIPPEVSLLTTLTDLSVAQNLLERLPWALGTLTQLVALDVRGNPMVSPPDTVLAGGKDLILSYLSRMLYATLASDCRLDDCRLTKVPDDPLALLQLKALSLDRNFITTLPPQLALLTALTYLSVCDNPLTSLPAFIGITLRMLQVLKISRNDIGCLPAELGHLHKNLKELEFEGNPLTKPPAPVLAEGLEAITKYQAQVMEAEVSRVLRLTGFKLQTTPPELPDMPNLLWVDLSQNAISSLQKQLFELESLEVLDLSHNKLEYIPSAIEALSNITSLHITHNVIGTIPDAIGTLKKLRLLDLRNNHIFRVTESLSDCSALTELRLDANAIEELPPELARLTELEEFGFADNPLRSPPSFISSQGAAVVLRYLERVLVGLEAGIVNLSEFAFTQVPELVLRFTNLTELHLDHNDLTGVPSEIGTLVNLKETLALDFNRIVSLPLTIARLDKLSELRLSDNLLSTLPTTLVRMTSLKRLLLDRNRIEGLPPGLGTMPNLNDLSLAENLVRELPPDLSQTSTLRVLNIEDNPMSLPPPQITVQGIRAILKFLEVMMGLQEKRCLDFRDMGLTFMNLELLARQGVETVLLSNNRITILHEESMVLTNNANPAKNDDGASQFSGLTLGDIFNPLSAGIEDNASRDWSNEEGTEDEHNEEKKHGITLPDESTDTAPVDGSVQLTIDNAKGHVRLMSASRAKLTSAVASSRATSAVGNKGGGGGGGLPGARNASATHRLTSAATRLTSANPGLKRLLSGMNRGSGSGPGGSGRGEMLGKAENLRLLRVLKLDNNLITMLPPILGEMLNLRELSAANNKLERLPDGMITLSMLTSLSVPKNMLTCLPLELGMLPSLSFLNTDNNPLKMPPAAVIEQGMSLVRKYLARLWMAKYSTFALDLGGFGLQHLPEEVTGLTEMRVLWMQNSQLSVVPGGVGHLTGLTELSLEGNAIESLEASLFERLVKMVRLQLSRNRISWLPTSIGCMTALQELWLGDNPIAHLPLEVGHLAQLTLLIVNTHAFISPPPTIMGRGAQIVVQYLLRLANSTKTRTVDMRNMGLASFPPEVLLLTSLTLLKLDQNHLSSLPAGISALKDLTELSVTQNKLETLPVELGALPKLKTLSIDHSRLMTNPPYEVVGKGMQTVISYMRSMRNCLFTGELDISSMSMLELPGHLLLVPGLKILRAKGNQFMELPPELGQMSEIESISLQHNQLRYVAKEIMALSEKLRTLRLGHNSIASLPPQMAECSSLTILSVPTNILTEFTLGNMPSLTKLNLSANSIASLPESIGTFPALVKLRLDQNQLMDLPSTLGNLTNLTLLSVCCNVLKDIPETMVNCQNLTALHLSANQMSSVPRCIVYLKKLRIFWITDNQIQSLPFQLGTLRGLVDVQVDGNRDLSFPPPAINLQGTEAILHFLKENMLMDVEKESGNVAKTGDTNSSSSSSNALVANSGFGLAAPVGEE